MSETGKRGSRPGTHEMAIETLFLEKRRVPPPPTFCR